MKLGMPRPGIPTTPAVAVGATIMAAGRTVASVFGILTIAVLDVCEAIRDDVENA